MQGKILKKLLIALLVLGLLAGVGVGVIAYNFNTIVKTATEKGLAYVLQVDVSLGSVSVRPLQGRVVLNDLVIGNPEGFNTASAFSLGGTELAVDIKSFGTDKPIIELVSITDPKVTLEQGQTSSNLSTLVKNASRFSTGSSADEPELASTDEKAPAGAQKKFRIDKFVFAGATVGLSAPILQGTEYEYTLDTVELTEIGGKGAYVPPGDALKEILVAILDTAVDGAGGLVDLDFQKLLDTSLDDIKDKLSEVTDSLAEEKEKLEESVKEAVEEFEEQIDTAVKDLESQVESAKDELDEAVKEAAEKLDAEQLKESLLDAASGVLDKEGDSDDTSEGDVKEDLEEKVDDAIDDAINDAKKRLGGFLNRKKDDDN